MAKLRNVTFYRDKLSLSPETAAKMDKMAASLGFGPLYKPTLPQTLTCPKCKKPNAVIKELHPDTDMNTIALVCPDCGYEEER